MVLDTSRISSPGKKNDRAQARQFIWPVCAASRSGLTAEVLLLAQIFTDRLSIPDRHQREHGYGTIRCAAGSIWSASSRWYEPNPDARVLTTKNRTIPASVARSGLTWTAGVFIADAPMSAREAMNAGLKAERVFLKLLKLFAEQGRDVSAKPSPSLCAEDLRRAPRGGRLTKTRHFPTQAMEAALCSFGTARCE